MGTSTEEMQGKKLIVFDMDGVLVDVSGSYRDTVRQTARLFFSGSEGWEKLPDPLFSLEELARVKQSGGLNNDWDLTFLVISLLFSRVARLHDKSESMGPDAWIRYRQAMRNVDVSPLTRFLEGGTEPLTTLLADMGRHRDPFVSGLYAGDVGSGNVIKQIFQEVYLGRRLYEATYGAPPLLYHGDGYINREKLLIEKKRLEKLSRKHRLAIATGRPEAEARYPLERFKIRDHFAAVYTLDDCMREEKKIAETKGKAVSLSKPHPFMLDAVAAALQDAVGERFYVGDMPDDMIAASNAASEYTGIGIVLSAPNRDHLKSALRSAGARYIVEDFTGLESIVASHGR